VVSGCVTCIIHAFFRFFTQTHATSIFRFTVSLPAFFRPSVSSLGFSTSFPLADYAAPITAVGLSFPAALAHVKDPVAPAALNFLQQYDFIVFDR